MSMMSVVLDKIRRKKKEYKLSHDDGYLRLVREVASGREIDIDDAAITIEAAGRSDEDFEKDVSTQAQRFEWAEQLKRKQNLQRQLPQLEIDERIAGEHFTKTLNEITVRLETAKARARACANDIVALDWVEGKLKSTCLDAALLGREQELIERRKELHQQRLPLEDDLKRAKNYDMEQSTIEQFEAALKDVDTECRQIEVELSSIRAKKLVP